MIGSSLIAGMAIAALGGEGFGVSDSQNSPAADGAALTMLAVIFFVIGGVVTFGWVMVRRSRQPNETLQFLEDLSAANAPEAPATTPDAAPVPPPSWERPPDWWRKE